MMFSKARVLQTSLQRGANYLVPKANKSTKSVLAEYDKTIKNFDFKGAQQYARYLYDAFFPKQYKPEQWYANIERGDIDWGSCDYLNLARDPMLTKLEADALLKYTHLGQNRSSVYPRDPASPVMEFERRCQDWLNADEVMLVNSGMEANICVMQLLLHAWPNAPLYMDKYSHATLPLAARCSGRNDILYFNHNDVDGFHKLVKEHGPGILAIDTVYSALGTEAPLEKFVDICRANGVILIADEAHAIGVVGNEGEGLVKKLGLEKYVQFRTSSLNKGFGAQGGFITYNSEVAEGKPITRVVSATQVFSIAVQDWLATRLVRTLDIVKNENERRQELHDKTEWFRKGCIDIGYSGYYVKHTKTHVMPMVIGKVDFAQEVYYKFLEKAIYPSPHYYPASPRNKSVMRFTVCNFLSYEDMQKTLDLMEEIKDFAKPHTWPDFDKDVLDLGFSEKI